MQHWLQKIEKEDIRLPKASLIYETQRCKIITAKNKIDFIIYELKRIISTKLRPKIYFFFFL